MKRTTIMLPEDLKIRAMNHARMLGLSLGGFIRAALEQALRSKEQAPDDPLFEDTAVFYGQGPEDLSKRHDDYLYGEPS